MNDFWHLDSRDSVPDEIPRLILANKCDLQEDISDTEIRAIANGINAFTFIKTSAKDNIGVNSAFITLVNYIFNSSSNQENEKEDE